MRKLIILCTVILFVLLPAALTVNCQPQPAPAPPKTPDAELTPPASTEPCLDSVNVPTIEVSAGEKQQLEVIAMDEDGNRLSEFTAAWTMIDENAGSVTQTGLFEVGEVAGTFSDAVEVHVRKGELVRTATASVTITPGPLEQIVVAPDPAEIGIEVTQQFVAVGTDRYGNRIPNLAFNWSVENDGGSIDGTGLFTAGDTSGNYKDTVKVEASQGSITCSGTANVTVEPDRILFISEDIYIMDADGSNVNQLTDTALTEASFSCSPDGQRIVYASGGSHSKIMVMNINGSGKLCISGNDTKANNRSPAWSPDRSKIVFVKEDIIEETSDIYVVDADGGNLTQLTDTIDYDEYSPAWSPDTSKIVFIKKDIIEETSDIYVMDADGGNLTQLTDTSNRDVSNPAWFHDGTRITYLLWGTSWAETWVMNADGSDQRHIARGSDLACSPDGTQIAYVSSEGDIYVMDADGSKIRQLTSSTDIVTYSGPAWSPDGSKILFISREYTYQLWTTPGGSYRLKQPKQDEIWVIDADGCHKTWLTDNSKLFICGLRWVPRKRGIEVNKESVIIPNASSLEE